MIIALRSDKPEAELYLYDANRLIDAVRWQAHRTLSDTLLVKFEELLAANGKQLDDLTGLLVFAGPGSFTGLRIGITVINSLAFTQKIPNAGAVGEDWLKSGLAKLAKIKNPHIIMPEYGSEAHITKPKK